MSEKVVKRRRRITSLVTQFGRLPDSRRSQGKRHPQEAVLAIAVAAIAAGARSYAAKGEWAKALPPKALRRLGCRRGPNGLYVAPSAATIRRVLQEQDPVELNELILRALHAKKAVAVVAVDGKTLRGTRRIHSKAKAVLSALDVNTGLVLAQREVTEEHLEIPEFCPLLRDLPLQGAVVTADAMHTQVEHARFLVEDKQADFLFVVKGNQENLFGELNRWPGDRYATPFTSVDKGHGRIEVRTIWVSPVGDHAVSFPYVQQVFRMLRRVTDLNGVEIREEVSFGITSLATSGANAERLLGISRDHWGIENGLHWVKDMSLGEDACQVRQGAVVLACLRSAVVGALRYLGHANIAKAQREFAWDWRKSLALVGV